LLIVAIALYNQQIVRKPGYGVFHFFKIDLVAFGLRVKASCSRK
jgi:hypothetical protein